jgi:Uma2 family endonuclease
MSEMEAQEKIRPITVDDYHRMADAGIFGEEERVELLDGLLIAMPPEGPIHADVAGELVELFVRRLAGRAKVRPGNPLALDGFSEPQPDVALVRRRKERYLKAHPAPEDVLLLVEVSFTSLPYDRRRKLQAYARNGILEYWIVNCVDRRVEVYTDPHELGYASTKLVERGGSVAPGAFPDEVIQVDAFLP